MFQFNPCFLLALVFICETAYSSELSCDHTNYQDYIEDRRLTNKLVSQTFEGCNLENFDFSGQDLQRAYFYAANLQGANFVGANLTNAVFKDADLSGADLRGAIIVNTNLQGVIVDENTKCHGCPSH